MDPATGTGGFLLDAVARLCALHGMGGDEIAAEIVKDLQAALEQFAQIAADLVKSGSAAGR